MAKKILSAEVQKVWQDAFDKESKNAAKSILTNLANTKGYFIVTTFSKQTAKVDGIERIYEVFHFTTETDKDVEFMATFNYWKKPVYDKNSGSPRLTNSLGETMGTLAIKKCIEEQLLVYPELMENVQINEWIPNLESGKKDIIKIDSNTEFYFRCEPNPDFKIEDTTEKTTKKVK